VGGFVAYFRQDKERRSCNRFPLSSPIHLMADSGQIIIGTTQDIGSNGLSSEIAKSVERDSSVIFNFFYEKTTIGGYGRVVWSGFNREKNFCGIAFLKMKQKDKQTLNEVLDRIISPICPVCHSKLDIDKLIPYLERQFPKERIDYENASPLMEIAHLLNSNLSWLALMEKIFEVIKNRFHGEAVKLFLYNENTRMLELCCHMGLQSAGRFSFDAEKSIEGEAFRERKIIFIPDVQKNPSLISKDELKAAGIHSMIAIPLIAGGKALGILSLFTTLSDQRETLKKEEKELLSAFANLITVGMKMSTSDFKMQSAL
jgi:putative methionine-R-sulfoxide reductase with GAF domain